MKIYAVGLFGVLLTDSSFAIAQSRSLVLKRGGEYKVIWIALWHTLILLYAIALGLPPDGKAIVKSLALTSIHYPGQIADVKLVGYDHSLSYHRRSDALIIELPNDLPQQEAYCFKIIPA